MTADRLIHKIPFFRILLPFVIGIAVNDRWPFPEKFAWLFSLVAFGLIASATVIRLPAERFRYRFGFGIGVACLFFAFGILASSLNHREKTILDTEKYDFLHITIERPIKEKKNSFLYEATLTKLTDGNRFSTESHQPVSIYFDKKEKERFHPGDRLLIRNSLKPIENSGNPDAFDYRTYMLGKGIRYSAYIPENGWSRLAPEPHKNLKRCAWNIQQKLLHRLNETGLPAEKRAMLSAMILGYTQEITSEQKEAFSAAGLSHILAVSGLHVGIVLLLCITLLYPLSYFRITIVRSLLILTAIWGYAYLTGLSPSIVRSCSMMTLLIAGQSIGKRGISLNNLCVAAFLMLLYEPDYLYDIGFQLSFTAVAAIVLLYPYLERLLPDRPVFRYFVSILFVSLSAQIGTALISAFYFHTLPLWSLFTNLIAVPLLPFILFGTIILLLLTGFGATVSGIRYTIEIPLQIIGKITEICGSNRFAVLESIQVEPEHLIFYFSGIWMLMALIRKQTPRKWILLLVWSVLFLTTTLYIRPFFRSEIDSALLIYNRTEEDFIQIVRSGRNLIVPIDTLCDQEALRRTVRDFDRENRLPAFELVRDSTVIADISVILPFVSVGKKRLLILNSDHWLDKRNDRQPLRVDYAIIGRSFSGNIKRLTRLFRIDRVILSANVPPLVRYRMEKEGEQAGIPVYAVSKKGAWIEITE